MDFVQQAGVTGNQTVCYSSAEHPTMLCLVPSLCFLRLSFTNAFFHILKEKAAPLLCSELIVHDKYLVQTETD